jgi:desulfoferrodoxin (superoxide reductase-like protein)
MMAAMERRAFVRGSLLAIAAAPLIGGETASAQRRAPPLRADWEPTGPLTGREAADPSALTDEERMHAPRITLPVRVRSGRAFDLVVQVGAPPHECTEAHRIDWIEVALDERRVMTADLSLDVPFPILRVPIVLRASAMLVARAHCTQHGVWMTRRAIELAS